MRQRNGLGHFSGMCNPYSVTKGQQAIRDLYRAMHDRTGNMPPLPGVFPDYAAPIVRNTPDGRELTMARWGMPSPVFVLEGRKTDPGVTDIRNVKSPHWRRWMGVESRCLVPFTSFSETGQVPDGRRPPVWFALGDDRPMACVAGDLDALDVGAEGERGRGHRGPLRLPDDGAERGGRAHPPQAMPVILTTPEECDAWMSAPPLEAVALQRPLPDDALRIVACGEKQDPPAEKAKTGASQLL